MSTRLKNFAQAQMKSMLGLVVFSLRYPQHTIGMKTHCSIHTRHILLILVGLWKEKVTDTHDD